jgi:hypothetical protein
MPRFLIPLGIVAVGVIIYALIECLMTPKHQVRAFPKAAWILIVLLIPLIGALLWLFLGRVRSRRNGGTPGGRPATPRRPSSPDDDAAFLRQLDVQRQQQARKAELDRREAELKAREQQKDGRSEQPEDGGPASS